MRLFLYFIILLLLPWEVDAQIDSILRLGNEVFLKYNKNYLTLLDTILYDVRQLSFKGANYNDSLIVSIRRSDNAIFEVKKNSKGKIVFVDIHNQSLQQTNTVLEFGEKQELFAISNYKNGRLEGPSFLFDKRGNLIKYKFFKQGILDIIEIQFMADGSVLYSREIKEGYPHGYTRTYTYRNGNLSYEAYYLDGQFDGFVRRYYRNGNIKIATFFKAGNAEYAKIYNRRGKLIKQYFYQNDTKYKLLIYKRGKVSKEIVY